MLMQLFCLWWSSSFLLQSVVEVGYPVINIPNLLVDLKSRSPTFTSLTFMFVYYGRGGLSLLLDLLTVDLVIKVSLNISFHVCGTSYGIS